jgi:hypothetical protein
MGTGFSRSGGELPGEVAQVPWTDAGLSAASSPAGRRAGAPGQSYSPSWVDQLTDWVRRLPLPAWVFYLALGLALTLGS